MNNKNQNSLLVLITIIIDYFIIWGAWNLTNYFLDLDREMNYVIGWLWVLTFALAVMGVPFIVGLVLYGFKVLREKITNRFK